MSSYVGSGENSTHALRYLSARGQRNLMLLERARERREKTLHFRHLTVRELLSKSASR